MKTRKIEIALPVLRFTYSVTVEIPRFMTAFERLALVMVDRFAQAGRFQNATVPELFAKVLETKGVDSFVVAALDELLSPGVAALVTRNHGVSSENLRLDDLAVTEVGRRFLKDKRLGGETHVERRLAAYDLATGTLLDGRVAVVEHARAGHCVSHDVFRQVAPPQDAVCAATLANSPAGTRINGVRLETPEPDRLFRTVQATFGLKGGKPALFTVRGVDSADADRLRRFLQERMENVPVGDIFGGMEKEHAPSRADGFMPRFKSGRGKHGRRKG